MKKGIQIPEIPDEQRTPLVDSLLIIIEQLAERVRAQDEEIALLKDEIRILKGEKKRPRFKPSKMDEQTSKNKETPSDTNSGNKGGNQGTRAGSKKKIKRRN